MHFRVGKESSAAARLLGEPGWTGDAGRKRRASARRTGEDPKRCLAAQASWASNPATFLVSALNSTATKCTGSPKWRYLSA